MMVTSTASAGRSPLRARLTSAVLTGLLTLAWAIPALGAQEGEGGGGLLSVNPGLMIWTWVIFLLLLFVLGRYAWRPILNALEQREKHIEETLADAGRQREEAQRLLEEHRRMLSEARGEAQEILAEGRKAGERLRQELVEEARKQKESIVASAREDIERERDEALETLRREAVDLSISAASRVLNENLDSERNRRLVEDYLDRLARERDGGR